MAFLKRSSKKKRSIDEEALEDDGEEVQLVQTSSSHPPALQTVNSRKHMSVMLAEEKKKKKGFNFTKTLIRSFSSNNRQNNLSGLTTRDNNDSMPVLEHTEELDDAGVEYNEFTALLLKSDFTIVCSLSSSLLNTDEATEISPPLMQLIEANSMSQKLFRLIIRDEIEKTTDEGVLFRNTSVATLLMSAFGRVVGERYLIQLLSPLIHNFPKHSYCEVDPNRIQKGTPDENTINLIHLASSFIDAIISSIDQCPESLRSLCTILQEEVEKKFPKSKLSAVGGFFFLRFICPAIVTPQKYGIITDHGDPHVQRALILVSKILQSIASGVRFGEKESYMIPLNSFIDRQIPEITRFFAKLTEVFIDDSARTPTTPVMIARKPMFTIFQYVRANLRKLHDELVQKSTRLDYDPYKELQRCVTMMKKPNRNTIEIQAKAFSSAGTGTLRRQQTASLYM